MVAHARHQALPPRKGQARRRDRAGSSRQLGQLDVEELQAYVGERCHRLRLNLKRTLLGAARDQLSEWVLAHAHVVFEVVYALGLKSLSAEQSGGRTRRVRGCAGHGEEPTSPGSDRAECHGLCFGRSLLKKEAPKEPLRQSMDVRTPRAGRPHDGAVAWAIPAETGRAVRTPPRPILALKARGEAPRTRQHRHNSKDTRALCRLWRGTRTSSVTPSTCPTGFALLSFSRLTPALSYMKGAVILVSNVARKRQIDESSCILFIKGYRI